MARTGAACFSLLALLAPGSAWAMQKPSATPADAEVRDTTPAAAREPVDRERVIALLDNPRAAPSATSVRNLGGAVDGLLIELANQNDMGPRVRSRALIALGQLGTPAARKFLSGVVQSPFKRTAAGATAPESDPWMVRKAALALAYLPGADVPALLEPLLYHRDRDVRLDAIAALSASRHPGAIESLADYVGQEKDAQLKRAAEQQLAVLRRAVKRTPPPPPAPPRVRPPDFREREQPGVPPP